MSAGNYPLPPTLSGEAAERHYQQLPPHSQAQNSPGRTRTNGDAYGQASAAAQALSEPYASGMAPREVGSLSNGKRAALPSLPSINQMVGEPLGPPPNGIAPAPASLGSGPPPSYYPTTRADPRTFTDPARPALGSRMPPPPPLDIPAAQHTPTTHGGHHASRPPSRGPYPAPAQLPSGQYPLPSGSPRHHPPQTNLLHPPPFTNRETPGRYEHRGVPSPRYSNAAPGPAQEPTYGHDRFDRGFASWDYDEKLDRIKTYSHSISHFAESYIRAAREQNGGHPIQSRLPSEGEIKEMLDHIFIIKNCLQDINRMLPESRRSMESDRVDRSMEHKEQSMVTYNHVQPLPPMHTPMQPSQIPLGHHVMPSQGPPSQMTPHAQLPHRPTYSLTEHKHNNKRRGVSLDPSPSGRSSAARYADPPRKRAAPPGRCHSCNRVDTPEWRRGPDGARTLCNACGLHYAKLERKKATELKSIRPKPSGSATQA